MKTSLSKQVRRSFRYYFEGYDMGDIPIDPISIIKLGITKFTVKSIKGGEMIVDITLERPGLLIGKHGKRIEGLTNHLEGAYQRGVKLTLHESRLWY